MFPRDQEANRQIRAEQLAFLESHVASGDCQETGVSVESFFACSACRRLQRVSDALLEPFKKPMGKAMGAKA